MPPSERVARGAPPSIETVIFMRLLPEPAAAEARTLAGWSRGTCERPVAWNQPDATLRRPVRRRSPSDLPDRARVDRAARGRLRPQVLQPTHRSARPGRRSAPSDAT